jgi:hypothetical protein
MTLSGTKSTVSTRVYPNFRTEYDVTVHVARMGEICTAQEITWNTTAKMNIKMGIK